MPRNYGTGTVFQRGKRWWIQYSHDGKVVRESCGPETRNKADARRVLNTRLHESQQRGFRASAATVSDVLDIFVADQRRNRRKAAADAELRANRIRQALGALRAAKVLRTDVARFVAALERAGRTGPTINRYRAIWQRAFRLANEQGLALPTPFWPRHAESEPKRDYITEAVFTAVAAQLEPVARAVAVAALWTGCRRAELLAWRWDQVDLEQRSVLLPHTKNGRPRVVALAQDVLNELLRLEIVREKRYPGSPWVFTLDGRAPLSVPAFRYAWDKARVAAGHPGLRFHALRHTAITRMRAAGIPESVAMSLSGHRTRAVFDRYGIQPEDQLHAAIRLLEEKRNSTKLTQPSPDAAAPTKPN